MSNTLNLGTDGNWAVKKDSLLAYNSENGNFKPLPFSFSRASSATVVNKDGLIEIVGSGKARIDFKDDAKGALLLEPQRSNNLIRSEEFENASWIKSGSAITANQIISPNGSLNADLITSSGSSAFERVTQSVSLSGVVSYSLFVKKNTANLISLFINGTGIGVESGANIIYDFNFTTNLLSKNAASSSTATTTKVESFLNGWYRISISVSSTTITDARIYSSWNITNTLSSYIWGAQLEEGSFPTSYIPNYGTAAGVTRVADVCSNAGNNQVINSTEGVLYAEISALANDGTFKVISISDGSTSNVVRFYKNTTNNQLSIRVTLGGVNQFNVVHTLSNSTQNNKLALKYKENDFAFWVNGIEVNAIQTGTTFSLNTLNKLSFSEGNGLSPFYGNTKDLRVYTTALTDAELQALTTI